MSKQTETPIYDVIKRERARHAVATAPTDPEGIQLVGGIVTRVEERKDVRWFGLPWLRAGRG